MYRDDESWMTEASDDLVRTRDRALIAEMFNAISTRYDLMNRLMTFGRDGAWRRLAADAAMIKPGDRALDVAAGTGDMARELARRVVPGGEVVGIDVAESMLEIARLKTVNLPIRYQRLDVEQLDHMGEFEAVTVAFGLRNFADRSVAVGRMVQALRSGGRLVILELVPAGGRLQPLIRFYERRLIPLVGGLVSGNRHAYRYLPQSVQASATPAQIEDLLRSAGLVDVASRRLSLGAVAICSGTKP